MRIARSCGRLGGSYCGLLAWTDLTRPIFSDNAGGGKESVANGRVAWFQPALPQRKDGTACGTCNPVVISTNRNLPGVTDLPLDRGANFARESGRRHARPPLATASEASS